MLQTIRDKSQGWIATVILGFISFTFALWGIHYYLSGSKTKTVVAKVNGVKISEQVFNQALRQLQQQAEAKLGNNYSNDDAFQNQLKSQVLAQLIGKQILVQALSKQGFFVGQTQVNQIILQLPAFQQNGKFSSVRFQQALANMQFSPEWFMTRLADQVMAAQLQKGLINSGFSLPDDVTNAIHLMKQTRDVGYIEVKTDDIKLSKKISEAEMKQYYANHQAEFTMPAKVSVSYVMLSVKQLKEKQTVTDKEVLAYYQNNKSQFLSSTKKQMPLDKVKSQIIDTLKENKAEKAFAQDSDNLANLAYENPTSLKSVARQLDLPINTTLYFAKNSKGAGILANAKVVKAAYSNDVFDEGYNSDVIEISPTKQVVLRVHAKTPAKLLAFTQVRSRIQLILEKQYKANAAKDVAAKIANALAQGQSGPAVAKQFGYTWHEKADVDRHQQHVKPKVLLQVFQMQKPHDRKHPMTKVIALPSGNYAAVALFGIQKGNPKTVTDMQKSAFSEVIGKKYGNVDYQLYLESLRNKAKIKKYVNFNETQI